MTVGGVSSSGSSLGLSRVPGEEPAGAGPFVGEEPAARPLDTDDVWDDVDLGSEAKYVSKEEFTKSGLNCRLERPIGYGTSPEEAARLKKDLLKLPPEAFVNELSNYAAATQYDGDKETPGQPSVAGFIAGARAAQDPNSLIRVPGQKVAHPNGVSGKVSIEHVSGQVPEAFAGRFGYVRLAPGSASKAPGLSLLLPLSDGAGSKVETRLFVNLGATAYRKADKLSTEAGIGKGLIAIKLSTAGSEGPMTVTMGDGINVSLQQQPDNMLGWMKDFEVLSKGSQLAQISGGGETNPWSVNLIIDEAEGLRPNRFADMQLAFHQPRKATSWQGKIFLGFANFISRICGFVANVADWCRGGSPTVAESQA